MMIGIIKDGTNWHKKSTKVQRWDEQTKESYCKQKHDHKLFTHKKLQYLSRFGPTSMNELTMNKKELRRKI